MADLRRISELVSSKSNVGFGTHRRIRPSSCARHDKTNNKMYDTRAAGIQIIVPRVAMGPRWEATEQFKGGSKFSIAQQYRARVSWD